jgi:hypothetical protein
MLMDEDVSVGYAGTFEGQGFPSKPSADCIELCKVEWSWSPFHSRSDQYFLDIYDNIWLLWLTHFDDGEEQFKSDIVGFMAEGELKPGLAAKLLLTAFWRYDESVGGPGCFHEAIAKWLKDADLNSIAQEVWDDNEEQRVEKLPKAQGAVPRDPVSLEPERPRNVTIPVPPLSMDLDKKK